MKSSYWIREDYPLSAEDKRRAIENDLRRKIEQLRGEIAAAEAQLARLK